MLSNYERSSCWFSYFGAHFCPVDGAGVVCFGFGNWLGEGGLGVSVVGNEAAEGFAGLIFISPVMATHITDSPTFLEQWRGRPVLIISGETDDRVPADYVRQRIAHLEAGGVALTSHIYPAQDHFLFFYAEEQLRADLVSWLTAVDGR